MNHQEWQAKKRQAPKQVRAVTIKARQPWSTLQHYGDEASSGQPHSRYDVEIGVLRCGRLRRFQGDHQSDIGPGEIWLNGMWETCRWEILEAPCREMVFFVSPETLLDLCFPETQDVQWLLPFMVEPALRPG